MCANLVLKIDILGWGGESIRSLLCSIWRWVFHTSVHFLKSIMSYFFQDMVMMLHSPIHTNMVAWTKPTKWITVYIPAQTIERLRRRHPWLMSYHSLWLPWEGELVFFMEVLPQDWAPLCKWDGGLLLALCHGCMSFQSYMSHPVPFRRICFKSGELVTQHHLVKPNRLGGSQRSILSMGVIEFKVHSVMSLCFFFFLIR